MTFIYYNFLIVPGSITTVVIAERCLPNVDNIEDIKQEEQPTGDEDNHELNNGDGRELDFLFPISYEYGTDLDSQGAVVERSHSRKSYHCPVCNKEFVKKSLVKKHLKFRHWTDRYKCSICDGTFATRNKYQKHLKRHFTLKSHKCEVCDMPFVDQKILLKHISENHVSFIKCPLCPETFECRKDLQSHTLQHIQDRPFLCPSCDDTFETETCLKRHLADHDAPVVCPLCGKNPGSKKALDLHLVHHSASEPYSCCLFRFKSMKGLKSHLKYHNKNKIVHCGICNKVLVSKSALKIHHKSHHDPYKCDQCDKVFKFASAYGNHLRSHGKHNFCTKCNENFKSYESLQTHNIVNHSEPKKFTCDTCGKGLSTRSGLLSHIGLHSDKKEESRKCKTCGLVVATKNKFNKHLETHREENKFSCDVCRQRFFTSDLLDTHTENYHNHKCDNCDDIFATYSQLKRHCHKIHGPRSMMRDCPVCGISLCNKNAVKMHMERHNNSRPKFTCPICSKSYVGTVYLRKHMEVHDKKSKPKRFVCPLCGARLLTNVTLRAHIKLHENGSQTPCICSRCGLKMASTQAFHRHLLTCFHNSNSQAVYIDTEPITKVEVDPLMMEYNDNIPEECPLIDSSVKMEILEPEIKAEPPDEISNNNYEIE